MSVIKCSRCYGSKIYTPLGFMVVKCPDCFGVGLNVVDDKAKVIEPIVAEVQPLHAMISPKTRQSKYGRNRLRVGA